MNLTIVAGTRPNFVKIAPLIKSINKFKKKYKIDYRLIHTGQHYDEKMSLSFFKQLDIPKPNVNLNVGSGTQAEQTAAIMVNFEKEIVANLPDYVIVVGDVNSTMACSVVTKKLKLKLIHIEAGIRSWDLDMPEEINRLITDSITDLFFTTSEEANKNLLNSGISKNKIFYVGNIMIDTLYNNINRTIRPQFLYDYNINDCDYFVLTMHRPSNVDDINVLKGLIDVIDENTANYKIIFPVHPRTNLNLSKLNLSSKFCLVDPLSYLEFSYLIKNSKAIITDSGGITEEATVFNVPCITLRSNTERPETVSIGTNELAGNDPKIISNLLQLILNNRWKEGSIPHLWDGKTSDRIISHVINHFKNF